MQKLAICTSSIEPPTTNLGSNCLKHPNSGSVETFVPFSQIIASAGCLGTPMVSMSITREVIVVTARGDVLGKGHRARARMLAVLSLVALLVSGCGGGALSTATSGPGFDAAPAAVSNAELLFDDVANGVRGTQAQSDAVRYLEHVTFQQLLVDCMAAKGFVYKPLPAFRVPSPVAVYGGGVLEPIDSQGSVSDSLGLDATLSGIVSNAKAGKPVVMDTGNEVEARISDHEVPGWAAASNECLPAIGKLDALVAHPSYERTAQFTGMVDEILSSNVVVDAISRYPDCMRAAGWNVKDRNELAIQVRESFEQRILAAARSFSTVPARRAAQVDELLSSEPWDALEQKRSDAASADAECRHEAHDLAFGVLAQPLQSFATAHRGEIEQLRAEWAAFEKRANETPDPADR